MIDVRLYIVSSDGVIIDDIQITYKTIQVVEDHGWAKVCAIWNLGLFPHTAYCFHDFLLDTNILSQTIWSLAFSVNKNASPPRFKSERKPVRQFAWRWSSRRTISRSLNGWMETCLLARISHCHNHQQNPDSRTAHDLTLVDILRENIFVSNMYHWHLCLNRIRTSENEKAICIYIQTRLYSGSCLLKQVPFS